MANLCHISYYHLRELQRVRRYLNHETAVKVASAWVSSRLDYCNSLLYNTKKAYTGRLQKVQNALFSTVCKLTLVMSHPSCTNYTGSPFITVYCSNIVSLLIKQYISANLHIFPLRLGGVISHGAIAYQLPHLNQINAQGCATS